MWASGSINSEEAPCFVLVVECAWSCLLPACSRQPKWRRRRALRKVHVVSKGSRHRHTHMRRTCTQKWSRTYKLSVVLCVSSTGDRKEKERDERIAIMCTSFKRIGTLISVSMMPVIFVFAALSQKRRRPRTRPCIARASSSRERPLNEIQ